MYSNNATHRDQYWVNEQVLLYVEAGNSPSMFFEAAGAYISSTVTITGYLVDLTL